MTQVNCRGRESAKFCHAARSHRHCPGRIAFIFLAPLDPSARSESARFSARSSASSARSDDPSLTGVGRSRSSAFRACDKRHDGRGKNVEPNHEPPHHLIILNGEPGQHEGGRPH